MTLTRELLLTTAAERLRLARPELTARLDLSDTEALVRAKAAVAGQDGPADAASVVAVIGRFSLPQWVRETCRFALSLPPDRADSWRRSFTRTVCLAGQPANLRERFAFDHIADDGSAAWLGPTTDAAALPLRRLLKTFDGARPAGAWAPVTVETPARDGSGTRRPVHRDVYVATARTTVSDLLVQVNHLLAEAVMDGLIRPGDRLTLRSVPRLAGLAVPFAALRVDIDTHRPRELMAYAGLTEET